MCSLVFLLKGSPHGAEFDKLIISGKPVGFFCSASPEFYNDEYFLHHDRRKVNINMPICEIIKTNSEVTGGNYLL
jgi:hypothetical protein